MGFYQGLEIFWNHLAEPGKKAHYKHRNTYGAEGVDKSCKVMSFAILNSLGKYL